MLNFFQDCQVLLTGKIIGMPTENYKSIILMREYRCQYSKKKKNELYEIILKDKDFKSVSFKANVGFILKIKGKLILGDHPKVIAENIYFMDNVGGNEDQPDFFFYFDKNKKDKIIYSKMQYIFNKAVKNQNMTH